MYMHKHKCEHCTKSVVWEHPEPPYNLPDELRLIAHTCPECGNEQWYKYFGREPVTYAFKSWHNDKRKLPVTNNKVKCNRDCANCAFRYVFTL